MMKRKFEVKGSIAENPEVAQSTRRKYPPRTLRNLRVLRDTSLIFKSPNHQI